MESYYPEEDIESLWKDFESIKINPEPIKKINNELTCKNKNCNTVNGEMLTDSRTGDIICKNCGTVAIERYISDDPEWNNYNDDSGTVAGSNARCGTILDKTNPYDLGNVFIPKYMWTFHYDKEGIKRYSNLSKWAFRISYSSKQRAFDEGKYSFEQIQSILGLTDSVFNTSKLFWGIILKTDILKRGANRRGMKACCVFYACMCEKQQRSREDISTAFDIDGSADFTKGEKIFREIFEKDTTYSWILYKDSNNESMYSRYISQFGLPYRANKIMNLVKIHTNEHLLGIAAKSEIAGILYFTVKEIMGLKHPNKSEVAKTVGICNPTLNKVIQILEFFYNSNESLKQKLISIN
jgi:transcription initiation factor TFIIIB Brf1 subunit/transcription initiation factor TFIIB